MKSRRNTWILAATLALAAAVCVSLAYSDHEFRRRATAARLRPDGVAARPGRIYFASFPKNRLALDVWGWSPEVGHASVLARDASGRVAMYDYGMFKGSFNHPNSSGVVGWKGDAWTYGLVVRDDFSVPSGMTDDSRFAAFLLERRSPVTEDCPKGAYGEVVELWSVDVEDTGVVERFMEQLAADENRDAFCFWRPGGYKCGNVSRQAFDAARGGAFYHFVDLLWGGFPGADAPSLGTERTVYSRSR